MKSLIMSFIVYTAISSPLSASVAHIDTMGAFVDQVYKIVEHYKPEDVLIIFDIDNTLLRRRNMVGSDEWVADLLQQKIREGLTVQEACYMILPLYCHVLYHMTMECVEQETALLVNALQRSGFSTVCVTARSLLIAEQTLQQLRENNLSFLNTVGYVSFDIHTSTPAIHKDGVVFAGAQSKGSMIVQFIEKLDHKPKVVIFLDDKLEHVEKVARIMSESNIEFHGFRYSYCDKNLTAFDTSHAEQELLHILKYATFAPSSPELKYRVEYGTFTPASIKSPQGDSMNALEVKSGQIYRHYKGNLYKVIVVAVDTEGHVIKSNSDITPAQKRVIYQGIGSGHALPEIIWDRPYEMFTDTVEVDGKQEKRFTLCG